MVDQVFQEHDIGLHPANAEFPQRPAHACDAFLLRRRPGRHFLKQTVVIAGDERTRIGRAAIKPDAEAIGAAIDLDAPVVGDEILFRVLGGDAALHGMAVQPHLALRGDQPVTDPRAFGNRQLRLHHINAGDFLRHRVFHLNARVHLDEVKRPRIHIHQELGRACVLIVSRPRQPQRRLAHLHALGFVEIGGRGPLHHFLVAPLHRAVALEQVDDIAVAVAQELHFHVPRPLHQLFEIDLVIAESGLRLAAPGLHLRHQLTGFHNPAHAAPAAAPAGLQHHRIADFVGDLPDRLHVLGQGA